MKRILISFIALCLSAAAIAQRSENHNSVVSRNLEIFDDLYRILDIMYVDTISADTVIRWAIDGMLQRVDPFTAYYPEDNDDLRQMATGKYAGVGSIIRYSRKSDRVCISEPYVGTPSMEAGLKAGDLLISIDGKDLKGKPVGDVSSMLRGEAGTTFELKYQRPGEKKTRTARITRRTIQMPSVPYYGLTDGDVGYICLTGFTEGASREVRHALEDLKTRGARSLILDLRDNPGGALNEAVDIVNLFVAKGQKVVYTKGKQTSTNRDYHTTTDPIDEAMPLVVLVNGQSASSSEIVSGSLQDLDRAVIMGTRTYGKGLVQMIHELPYRGQIKITTSRYYIPSGRCIQAYDYNHDGTIKTVPDSLQKTFLTRGGRQVKDGGGIMPDITITPDSLPTMIFDLVQSDAYFDYITSYVQKHPAIAEADKFHMTDEEYDEFIAFVQAEDFTYNRRSEDILKLLRNWISTEGYMDKAKDELDALQNCLKTDLGEDMKRNKKAILSFLENEIVHRYYYLSGGICNQVANDPVITQACEILHSPEQYSSTLQPKDKQ